MKKMKLENVFEQLSSVDSIDDLLRDEGLDPEQVSFSGMDKLKSIQSVQVSKKKVLELLKDKMKESVTKETRNAVDALNKLIPSLTGQQLSMVFQSLKKPEEDIDTINLLIKDLISNSELQNIMKKYRPDDLK